MAVRLISTVIGVVSRTFKNLTVTEDLTVGGEITKSAIDEIVVSTTDAIDTIIADSDRDSDTSWPQRSSTSSYMFPFTGGGNSFSVQLVVEGGATDVLSVYDNNAVGVPLDKLWTLTNPTSVSYMNGEISIGTSAGQVVIDLIRDQVFLYSTGGKYLSDQSPNTFDQSTVSWTLVATADIVNNAVSRTAITALSSADVDSEGGLKLTTKLCMTGAGASIVNHDGSTANVNVVVDLTGAVSLIDGDLDQNGFIVVASSSKVYVFESVPSSDTALSSADYEFDTAGSSGPHIGGAITSVKIVSSDGSGNAIFLIGTSTGVFRVDYITGGSTSVISQTSKDFATGGMPGATVGAWLMDSVSGDLADTELATNGNFDTDTDWSKGVGWTIGAGVASCDGTQTVSTNLSQNMSLLSDKAYRVVVTISGYSAGTVRVGIGSSNLQAAISANGIYEFIDIRGNDGTLYIQGDANFVGSVDNISVTEAVIDRSVRANHLTVNGTIPRTLIGGVTEYGPLGTGNFFNRDSDGDWDTAGNGTLLAKFDFRCPGNSTTETLLSISNAGATVLFNVILDTDGTIDFTVDGATASDTISSTLAYDDGMVHTVEAVQISNVSRALYIDKILIGTSTTDTGSITDTGNLPLYIGVDASDGSTNPATTTKIANVVLSGTQMNSAVRPLMYAMERRWFTPGDTPLFGGTSNSVQGVSYDFDTNKVDLSTSDGTTTVDLTTSLRVDYIDSTDTPTSDNHKAVSRVDNQLSIATAAEVVFSRPEEHL